MLKLLANCAALAILATLPARSRADGYTVGMALEDAKLYFTSPLRWDAEDWMFFGGTLAAVEGAHWLDDRVRFHFATSANSNLVGGDRNSLRDAAPTIAIVAGTWAYAGFIRDKEGYQETWSLLEAGVLSSVTAETFSLAGGRERPDVTSSPNRWFHGGDSFPSLHVSAAFAVGTVFAESGNDEYRWIRRLIGYGAAAATGYVRIKDNEHWLSDTVAGAALGIATARFELHRPNSENHSALNFQRVHDGWQLTYTVKTL